MKKRYLFGVIAVIALFLSPVLFGRVLPSNPTLTDTYEKPSVMHSIAIQNEKDFILAMIPHHEEAVEASQVVLMNVQDEELRKFAMNVARVQSEEAGEMKRWFAAWYGEKYSPNSDYLPMMADLAAYQGRDREKLYIEGMIFHHQAAVEMATEMLKRNPRAEVKMLADAIINVQQEEIKTLQAWLDSKYTDVVVRDSTDHQLNIHK